MDSPSSPPESASDPEIEHALIPAVLSPHVARADLGEQRPRALARVVGPGRRERAYLAKLVGLETTLAARSRELEAAALLERGSARRLDRMERKLAAVREAAFALEQKEHRLILALGALQRENEILREKLTIGAGEGSRRAALDRPRTPPPKRSWMARLVRRA